MANRILTTEGWEGRVRDKLGVSDAYLPDSALQQPDVITVAEAEIIAAVPHWEALTGDDRVFLEAATVAACAIQVIVSMPGRLPTTQRGPHMDMTLTVDWAARRVDLEAERDRFLGRILGNEFAVMTGFWTVGPKRRQRW